MYLSLDLNPKKEILLALEEELPIASSTCCHYKNWLVARSFSSFHTRLSLDIVIRKGGSNRYGHESGK